MRLVFAYLIGMNVFGLGVLAGWSTEKALERLFQ